MIVFRCFIIVNIYSIQPLGCYLQYNKYTLNNNKKRQLNCAHNRISWYYFAWWCRNEPQINIHITVRDTHTRWDHYTIPLYPRTITRGHHRQMSRYRPDTRTSNCPIGQIYKVVFILDYQFLSSTAIVSKYYSQKIRLEL